MKITCVNVDAMRKIRETIAHVNSLKLEEIEWVNESGKKIKISKEILEQFEASGLQNFDLVEKVLDERSLFPSNLPEKTALEAENASLRKLLKESLEHLDHDFDWKASQDFEQRVKRRLEK